MATAAQAGEAVWITEIKDRQTGAADEALMRELRVAAGLAGPAAAGWAFGEPDPSVCAGGCRVIEIAGHRGPPAEYKLVLRGSELSTRLLAPEGTSVFALAEALVLKCSFLLEQAAAPAAGSGDSPEVPGEPDPPSRADALRIGVEPSVMIGLDQDYVTVGLSLAATYRFLGPVAVRATIGWQELGLREVGDSDVWYHGLPTNLMAGAVFQEGAWSFGVFGGVWIHALWLELHEFGLGRQREVAVGAVIEGNVRLNVLEWLEIGLVVRPGYVSDEVDVTSDEDGTLFLLPHFFLSAGLELAVGF